MRGRLHKFLKADSGAAVVEYVVIAAATVGLGIGTINLVTDGATNFTNSGTSSANNSGVVDTGTGTGTGTGGSNFCEAGSDAYKLAMLSDYDAQDARDALARYSDDQLQQAYSDLQEKSDDILNGGSIDDMRHISDDVHLLSLEMADRRLDAPNSGTQFADLTQRLTASLGVDECGTGGGGVVDMDDGGNGAHTNTGGPRDTPQMLFMTDADIVEFNAILTSDSDRRLMTRLDDYFRSAEEALREGQGRKSARRIDRVALILQEVMTRDPDPRYVSSAQESLDRLYAAYEEMNSDQQPTIGDPPREEAVEADPREENDVMPRGEVTGLMPPVPASPTR